MPYTSHHLDRGSLRSGSFGMLSLVCLLLLTAPGCESGRQWFQMSSDAPMPMFGFDLLPRRRSTRPIADRGAESLTIQTADDRGRVQSSFQPRILATRTADAGSSSNDQPVPELVREPIVLPELTGRASSVVEVSVEDEDREGEFPEPVRLSWE